MTFMTPTRRLLAPLAVTLALATPMLTTPALATTPHDTSIVPAGIYMVEPAHTQILFAVDHLGFSTYYGNFSGASGSLMFDPGAITRSALSISVPTGSVSTTDASLTDKLKNANWLDAQKYPAITFVATQIAVTGGGTGTITGNLTLHGVTRPVTLEATYHGAGPNAADHKYALGFDATGTLSRAAFGVSTYEPFIGDSVKIIISAVFEK